MHRSDPRGFPMLPKSPLVFRHRVKRCVGFMHPEIDEKWLLMAVTLFDEGDGAVGVFMNRDLLPSTIESTKLIVSVFARQR